MQMGTSTLEDNLAASNVDKADPNKQQPHSWDTPRETHTWAQEICVRIFMQISLVVENVRNKLNVYQEENG